VLKKNLVLLSIFVINVFDDQKILKSSISSKIQSFRKKAYFNSI